MWCKYIIRQDELVLALKYHITSHKTILGGWNSFHEQMEIIIDEYFKAKTRGPYFPMPNKMRYEFKMKHRAFRKILKRLEEDGFLITRVKSHENLLR